MTTRPIPWATESTQREVREAITNLRTWPGFTAELIHREVNGWHILLYRVNPALAGPAASDMLILATQDFNRLVNCLERLYQERRPKKRKPPQVSIFRKEITDERRRNTHG